VTLVISFLSRCLSMPEHEKKDCVKKLTIVRNSSIHLQNVIEDALDVTRIENNKFELNKADFDIRKAVKEVFEIMQV
jgi:signal transduction histidine kinase